MKTNRLGILKNSLAKKEAELMEIDVHKVLCFSQSCTKESLKKMKVASILSVAIPKTHKRYVFVFDDHHYSAQNNAYFVAYDCVGIQFCGTEEVFARFLTEDAIVYAPAVPGVFECSLQNLGNEMSILNVKQRNRRK